MRVNLDTLNSITRQVVRDLMKKYGVYTGERLNFTHYHYQSVIDTWLIRHGMPCDRRHKLIIASMVLQRVKYADNTISEKPKSLFQRIKERFKR